MHSEKAKRRLGASSASHHLYAPQNVVTSEKEREEALKLLKKSELKKKKVLKQKLDKKIDEEVAMMVQESERRRQERLQKLLVVEKQREEDTQNLLKLVELNCNNMYKKKQQIVHKLMELYTKQKLHELGQHLFSEGITPTQILSHDDVVQLSIEKQKKQVDDMIPEAREKLDGTFIAHFERFSRIPFEEEIQEIRTEVNNFIEPYLNKRHQIVEKARNDSQRLIKKTKDKIILERKQEITKELDKKLVEEHNKKCRDLQNAKAILGISANEIEDLLEIVPVKYVTDIGIKDAEMEALRKKITAEQAEQKFMRESHKNSMNAIRSELGHLNDSLPLLKLSVSDIRAKLKRLQNEEKEAKAEIQSMTKEDLNIKIHETTTRLAEVKEELAEWQDHVIKEMRQNLSDKLREAGERLKGLEEENVKLKIYDQRKNEVRIQIDTLNKKIATLQEKLLAKNEKFSSTFMHYKEQRSAALKVLNEKLAAAIMLEDIVKVIKNSLILYNQEKPSLLSQDQEAEKFKSLARQWKKHLEEQHADSTSISTYVSTLAAARALGSILLDQHAQHVQITQQQHVSNILLRAEFNEDERSDPKIEALSSLLSSDDPHATSQMSQCVISAYQQRNEKLSELYQKTEEAVVNKEVSVLTHQKLEEIHTEFYFRLAAMSLFMRDSFAVSLKQNSNVDILSLQSIESKQEHIKSSIDEVKRRLQAGLFKEQRYLALLHSLKQSYISMATKEQQNSEQVKKKTMVQLNPDENIKFCEPFSMDIVNYMYTLRGRKMRAPLSGSFGSITVGDQDTHLISMNKEIHRVSNEASLKGIKQNLLKEQIKNIESIQSKLFNKSAVDAALERAEIQVKRSKLHQQKQFETDRYLAKVKENTVRLTPAQMINAINFLPLTEPSMVRPVEGPILPMEQYIKESSPSVVASERAKLKTPMEDKYSFSPKEIIESFERDMKKRNN